MLSFKKIAIVGSTGMVGKELQTFLLNHPIKKFSSRTPLSKSSFEDLDLAFFCSSNKISKEWVPVALASNTFVIDLSSAYREDPQIPLVIPEINGHLLENNPRLVSSPNCTASILSLALFPLHKLFGIKKIILSSYQAISGAGRKSYEELLSQTAKKEGPLAFNLYLHPGDEEEKVVFETRKIFNLPALPISATCVRVPTLRAHSISVFAEFSSPVELGDAKKVLQHQPGIALEQVTPQEASGKEEVFVGRIRKESSHALHLWIVGDQLLKGAALNAFQIAKNLQPLYHMET
ncbi:MAG: Asd/ArgC dimerization domain-containing protein [Candidatus Algichlamydia australiensis]|nr:Asd/ArgC dimerization domain-containing protein [Chlamydiales bacterium]